MASNFKVDVRLVSDYWLPLSTLARVTETAAVLRMPWSQLALWEVAEEKIRMPNLDDEEIAEAP